MSIKFVQGHLIIKLFFVACKKQIPLKLYVSKNANQGHNKEIAIKKTHIMNSSWANMFLLNFNKYANIEESKEEAWWIAIAIKIRFITEVITKK